MSGTITIEDYLRSVSPLVSDEALRYILVRRGIEEGTPISSLSEKEKDLAEGYTYYWLSNLPVGGSTRKDADGDWSHSEGGWQVSNANIAEWKAKYKALFSMWDEPIIETNSKIRLINF